MDVRSTTKYARVSPKKARDVAREIQGLNVSDALDALTFTPRKSAHLIGKTLKSAIANAENNFELAADALIVKSATVTDGPTLKRFKPRARGSAGAIRKRTSHINIIISDDFEPLEEKQRSGKAKKRDTIKPMFGKGATLPTKKETTPADEKPAEAAEAAEPSKPAQDTQKVTDQESPAQVDPENLSLGQVYDQAPADMDDLKTISGVGPALEEKLHGFGIYTYEQIANWNEENIAAFDHLLSFKGRIERDNWLEQAKELHDKKENGSEKE